MALRFAQAASSIPNMVTDEDFDGLKGRATTLKYQVDAAKVTRRYSSSSSDEDYRSYDRGYDSDSLSYFRY